MNKLTKIFLYPVISTVIILLITSLNWLITKFFSIILNVTMGEIVRSPIFIIYIVSFFTTVYMIISCCEYIEREL